MNCTYLSVFRILSVNIAGYAASDGLTCHTTALANVQNLYIGACRSMNFKSLSAATFAVQWQSAKLLWVRTPMYASFYFSFSIPHSASKARTNEIKYDIHIKAILRPYKPPSSLLILKAPVGKREVADSIPGGDIYFHFEIFARFPFMTARRSR